MRLAGVLPEDAPDPRQKLAEQLKLLPIPVMGSAPQPSLEDAGDVTFTGSEDYRGCSVMAASITYTLWRNPHDRSDPINLAELDEQARRALDEVPPWPRPAVPGRANPFINGVEVPGVEIDAEPWVYGLGAELPGGGVMTAVGNLAEHCPD